MSNASSASNAPQQGQGGSPSRSGLSGPQWLRRGLPGRIRRSWQNLPISQKLRISLLGILLFGIALIVVSAQGVFSAVAFDTARSALQSQAAEALGGFQNAFDQEQRFLNDFVRQTAPIMQDLAAARDSAPASADAQSNNAEYQRIRLTTDVLARMQAQRDVYYSVRFLNPDGSQVLHITRDLQTGTYNVVPAGALESEAQNPIYRELSQLQTDTLYFAAVRSVGGSSPQAAVLFEFGEPVAVNNQRTGYWVFQVAVTDALRLMTEAGTRERETAFSFMDENRQVLASNIAGRRYVYDGNTFIYDDPLPAAVFGTADVPDLIDNTVYPGGNVVPQLITTRVIPIRTTTGLKTWRLVLTQSNASILAPVEQIREAVRVPVLIVLALVLILTNLIARRLTHPLGRISLAARRIAGGDLNVALPVQGDDEFGVMSESLNMMAARTSSLIGDLENRVAARTRDIQATAEISRDLSSIRDLDELMVRAVDLLRDRFGFYHVQIFLTDENRRYAVLRASTGDVGQQLLERSHRLEVGSFSVIGQVAEKDRAFVTLDTRNSEVPHRFNPLLPNTRSEMGLPLRASGRVIGALDVQSELADAFDETTVRVFQVLADQLAFLIENARLLRESTENMGQVAALNRQLTRRAWDEFRAARPDVIGYEYDSVDVRPVSSSPNATDAALLPAEPSASVAEIRVRGQTIGKLSAASIDGTALSPDDQILLQSVAERVAIAIDNVRQAEQTQLALAEIERLYQTSRALSSAADLAHIYAIAAEQLQVFEQVDEVRIWRTGPSGVTMPEWVVVAFTWKRSDGEPPAPQAIERTVPRSLANFGPARLLSKDREPVIIPDLSRYPARDSLTDLIDRPGTMSLGLFPLRVADRGLGLLVIAAGKPDAVPPPVARFATALADQLAVAIDNRLLLEETQRSRETLQTILDSLPAGVVVVDALTRKITLTNASAVVVLGLDISGTVRASTNLPAAADPLSEEFIPYQVLTSGQPLIAQDVDIQQGPDDRRRYLVNAVPVFGADGQITASVAVFTDATELRQLEEILQQNLLETSALYQASQLIREQDSLAQILQAALQETQEFVRADILYFVFQDENRVLNAVYEVRPNDVNPVIALQSNPPLLYGVLDETSPVISDDTERDGYDLPYRSIGTFPMKARNRTVGWVVLCFMAPHVITDDQRRFLDLLSDQIASAAESTRLAQATADALRETELLYGASRAVAEAANVGDVAAAIRDQMLRLTPDRVDIFVLRAREQMDQIDWVLRYEAAPPSARTTMLLDGGYLNDTQFLLYEPAFVENRATATAAEAEMMAHLPNAEAVRAQISIPLRVQSSILGRVVISFLAPRPFSPAEQQFVTTVLDQASTVIDNVMLFQQSQESLEETSTLYQASRAINDASDAEGILRAIIDHAVPPAITRATLLSLQGPGWDAPSALVVVEADWTRSEDTLTGRGAGLVGLRLNREQLAFWDEIAASDIRYVNDTSNSATLNEIALAGFESFGYYSFVSVPLIASGKPIGAVLIGADVPFEHQERDLRLYANLADQAAIAIQNRSLLRETEYRARQLATSVEVGRAATSLLNLQELLDRTVVLIKEAFSYDHAQIFLISDDGKTAVLKASTGEAGRLLLNARHSLPVGSASVIGTVTSSSLPYTVNDTMDSTQVHRPNIYLPKTRSELAIPLKARGRTIGALDVQSNRPGAFSSDDQQVLSTLADQIAVAIDNARLFELSTQRLEEVRFLFNVTRTAAAVEIDIALTRVTRDVLENTGSDLVTLMLFDETRERLLVTYSAREGALYVMPVSVAPQSPLIEQCLRLRQPVVRNDHAEGLLFNAEDVPGIQSLVLVPLIVAEQTLGVLAAAATGTDAYPPDRVQLLETLASTLSAIVRNAQLLAEVQEANMRLREVDKLKSQFLANMSHELRTPLNSIIGFSRIILKGIDGPLNETQSQDLTTIHESGKHLLNLVNDILDQAKIEAGKMELSYEFFALDDVIKSVMSTAVGLVKDKPIRLHQELQAGLPQAYGDEFRTRQVLLNMLSNAAKFTKQGSITVSAFMAPNTERPMIQVAVADTGIGIAPENIRRVFAQFEQVDNSTARGAEGTGLGMPIAKSLIEMMGGQIWVDSTPGVGSTFNITIPTQPVEQAPEEAAASPEGAEIAPADAQPLPAELEAQVEQAIGLAETPRPLQRIVVAIDDEAGMLSMYRRYLAKAGFELIGTTNPEEAVDLIVNYQPSVVLLDVNMPKRNGWEVLEALKDRDETFEYPVIVCSIEDSRERAFRLGAADYLVKPFLEEDLLAMIRRVQLERNLPCVLVVDPDAERLSRTAGALTAGEDTLRVAKAQDTQQALDMVSAYRPSLLLVDSRSGGLNLRQLVSGVRGDQALRSTRILIIPVSNIDPDELMWLAGQDVHFETGFTDAMILDLVRAQLGPSGDGVPRVGSD